MYSFPLLLSIVDGRIWHLSTVNTHQQVIDPSGWCGAAFTALCEGCGEHSWISSLVESGIKVTGNLARAFVASEEFPERDLVAEKQYSWLSASTMSTRGGFCTYQYHEIHPCFKSLLTLISLRFRILYLQHACLYILILLGLPIGSCTSR